MKWNRHFPLRQKRPSPKLRRRQLQRTMIGNHFLGSRGLLAYRTSALKSGAFSR